MDDDLRPAGAIRTRPGRPDAPDALADQARGLAAFARPGWRTAREMHQDLERALQAGVEAR